MTKQIDAVYLRDFVRWRWSFAWLTPRTVAQFPFLLFYAKLFSIQLNVFCFVVN